MMKVNLWVFVLDLAEKKNEGGTAFEGGYQRSERDAPAQSSGFAGN